MDADAMIFRVLAGRFILPFLAPTAVTSNSEKQRVWGSRRGTEWA